MKTPIVETGKVVKTENGLARVQIGEGSSCKGCGMAELGLCKPGGSGMLLEVMNGPGARKGDTVTIGLDQKTHLKGYFLAFILPLALLITGAAVGHLMTRLTGITGLDVIAGFLFLTVTTVFSLKGVQKLDRTRKMHVRKIIRDVPEFQWKEDYGAEGRDYLKGFSG